MALYLVFYFVNIYPSSPACLRQSRIVSEIVSLLTGCTKELTADIWAGRRELDLAERMIQGRKAGGIQREFWSGGEEIWIEQQSRERYGASHVVSCR